MHFAARGDPRVEAPVTPSPFDPHAYSPSASSASFGGYPGAIWEPPPEEGLARNIWAAFVKDGVLFTALANLGDGRPPAEVDADVAVVRQILATITPY